MVPLAEPRLSTPATPEESLALLLAYTHLLAAALEGREQRLTPSANPVSLAPLRRDGVTTDIILWMLYQGHIEPSSPDGADANHLARGRAAEGVCLGEGSSFSLTPPGEAFAHDFLGRALTPEDDRDFQNTRALPRLGRLCPRYHRQGRAFVWGRHVLKRFRQPSRNQERVLLAAEELGWPAWFDDPLPPGRGRNPKVRLHDTIKCLNRHQRPPVIRFLGDGSGRRVGWELRYSSPRASPADGLCPAPAPVTLFRWGDHAVIP
jgi:hypothetical protein